MIQITENKLTWLLFVSDDSKFSFAGSLFGSVRFRLPEGSEGLVGLLLFEDFVEHEEFIMLCLFHEFSKFAVNSWGGGGTLLLSLTFWF